MSLWRRKDFVLVLFSLWPLSAAVEMVDRNTPELRCSQGLTDCRIKSASPYSPALPDPDHTMDVTHVDLKVFLCCSQTCEPCLQVTVTVQDHSEESGDHSDEDPSPGVELMTEGSGQGLHYAPATFLKVCHSFPGSIDSCRMLQFRVNNSQSEQTTYELLLTEKVMFGSPVVVLVYGQSKNSHIRNITVPSLQEVCSMNLDGTVVECDAPRLRAVTDHKTNNILLQLDHDATNHDGIMCQIFWNEMPGKILEWPRGQKEMVILSSFVAPCLCFQVWWKGKDLRRQFCPFKNQQEVLERMQRNVSVSMEEAKIRGGGTVLIWNVTAPCRLEAEVWLCKKNSVSGQCEEVSGSRLRLHDHGYAGWSPTHTGHQKTGEFNVSSHPLLCVQLKVHGMESYVGPYCPFSTSRWRWSLAVLIGLVLMCLAILGIYFVQAVIKGYIWKWLKEDDVKGAVGGGHVVLLYRPDDDKALVGLVCQLGSSLQALGFSVSLDLWSQAELCVLGPVPWLHSRLDRLKRQGGKVVLVLTKAAWTRVEEWRTWSCERHLSKEKRGETKEDKAGKTYGASSPCVDVFTASLSCILADYLQGREGERFLLVQFESLPPEPPGGCCSLPELFRGLHLYSLPSQSLGFLTELAGARQMANASARRRRAGGLRRASRRLAQGLSGFTAGSTVLLLAEMSQSCVGIGLEDSAETVPLHSCLTTPSSSPETNPKVSKMEWV
ncbi:uncharacterized protein wu:fl23c11 [Thalassophryne amazonica]|uniref:uncharacterized protein wu:fl23c11 n=1 Tax=Thalassophryne amazonica TaxID=390379 RepID=UPI001470873A|nr:uncharacterized protein wu:fl23c11 [Thalassophryne amazonica]